MLPLHGTCTVLIQEICLHRLGKAGRFCLQGVQSCIHTNIRGVTGIVYTIIHTENKIDHRTVYLNSSSQ